MTAATHLS